MKLILNSFVVGFLFSLGLGISGMTQPQKILGFLDIFGNWDASLMFVMGGAVGLHLITYKLIRKRVHPIFDDKWHIPTNKKITPQLIIGSLLFGVGWGLAGYCPGPAIVSLVTGHFEVILFVSSMLFGMLIFKLVEKNLPFKKV
jgi:uncharacterized membrane protein YedE/YeeE